MNITVLSDGGWGTALALLLVRNGHNVRQWGPFPEYIREIRKSRENSRFLPDCRLPDEHSAAQQKAKRVGSWFHPAIGRRAELYSLLNSEFL